MLFASDVLMKSSTRCHESRNRERRRGQVLWRKVRTDRESQLWVCAVKRRRFPVGARPSRVLSRADLPRPSPPARTAAAPSRRPGPSRRPPEPATAPETRPAGDQTQPPPDPKARRPPTRPGRPAPMGRRPGGRRGRRRARVLQGRPNDQGLVCASLILRLSCTPFATRPSEAGAELRGRRQRPGRRTNSRIALPPAPWPVSRDQRRSQS